MPLEYTFSQSTLVGTGSRSRRPSEDYLCVEEVEDLCGHKVLLAAIFDGHGGPEAAEFCCKNFIHEIKHVGLDPTKAVVYPLKKIFWNLHRKMLSVHGKENHADE